MCSMIEIGKKAKIAAIKLAKISLREKNNLLNLAADTLIKNTDFILSENKKDIDKGQEKGIKKSLLDRLMLNEDRIKDMAYGLVNISKLEDPIGEVLYMKTLPNGLKIGQKRVAMGVIGIIYESRPNVTADAFGLCLKAGSACILRGGSDAINSNKAIVDLFRDAFNNKIDNNIVQLVEDTTRKSAEEMMKLNEYIDLLIPRGGAGLINSVVKNSTVSVIQTGVGNCHIFVDESADIKKAVDITINAKVQRPGVCNACETLLVHKNIAEKFLPEVCEKLNKNKVEIRGDEYVKKIVPYVKDADDNDWETEYLDYIIAVKNEDDINEAISHIQKYSTGHSEAIITENYTNANLFVELVDSAAVYVNASTRFTDGNEFGFGAEIGISTQKLHARGPMGIKELTSSKYIIFGDGQIRE